MSRRRRVAPQWVQELEPRELHALTGRLLREFRSADLTDAQDWLLDHCLDDLDWRWRNTEPAYLRCACMLCVPPFDPANDAAGGAE